MDNQTPPRASDLMEIKEATCFDVSPAAPMEEGAMRFLFELGKNVDNFYCTEIDGSLYANKKLVRIPPYEQPAPECMNIRTMTGVVDWLMADVDGVFADWQRVYLVVTSIGSIKVETPIYGEDNKRATLARCEVDMPRIRFNEYLPQEDFLVMLQTHFCAGPNRDGVAHVVGNIRMKEEADIADDGVSQRVTVRSGAASLAETIVQNPVMLAPRRTFPEVEQPSSPFVLRIKQDKERGPMVALYEADGGAWKTDAIRTVGDWLKEQVEGMNVVVIA